MNLKKPLPLNALRAFEAVARLQQVNLAAEELCVTSSAVSHLVRRLEEELGVQLLKRTGRHIELTEIGQKMSPDLQTAFSNLTRIVNDVRLSGDTNSVSLNLRPYFALKWLTPRLHRFWERYPGIELHLNHSIQSVDFQNLDVDLAIEWLKETRSDHECELLVAGELIPVCSPDMDRARKIEQPKDLLDFTLLRETDYDSWSDWFALNEIQFSSSSHVLYIDDSNVRIQAAMDGQGVELSCRSLVEEDIASGKLIAPLDISLNTFSYYLVHPNDRPLSEAAKSFKHWLMSEVNHS